MVKERGFRIKEMRNKNYILFCTAISFLLMAWWPYTPQTSLSEKKLNGPVRTVIENVANGAMNNIVVQIFNQNGKLIEIKYFEPKMVLSEDSAYMKILNVSNYYEPLNPEYKGLDTNKFVYSNKAIFHYNTNEKIRQKITLKRDNSLLYRYKCEYDTNDSLISEAYFHYNSFGKIEDSTLRTLEYFNYSTFNQKVIYENADIYFIDSYYSQNKVVKKRAYYKSDANKIWTIDYLYDEIGNLLKETNSLIKDTNSEKLKEILYVYNKNNRIESVENLDFLGGNLFKTEKKEYFYEYDKLKKLITTEEHNLVDPGNIRKSIVFFNEKGDVVRSIIVEHMDTLTSKFEYKYDNFGNWTSESSYKDDVFEDSIYRQIIYY
jgi:hypothetical protein